jgi:hypothetical protein
MHNQPINSAILKNLYQVKQETHINKKMLDINLVQLLWLDLDQKRLIKCRLKVLNILKSNLIIRRIFFKNESMKDMKCCVKQDSN